MERNRLLEKPFVVLEGALLALALVGCMPEGADAVTHPWGIEYRDEHPDEKTIKHEEAHWERAQREGILFWWNYGTDAQFRCDEEVRANTVAGYEDPYDHPACEELKKLVVESE